MNKYFRDSLAIGLVGASTALGCGARTGLEDMNRVTFVDNVPEKDADSGVVQFDAGQPQKDGGMDVGKMPEEAGIDGAVPVCDLLKTAYVSPDVFNAQLQ